MGLRGLAESPSDQRENAALLARAERQLFGNQDAERSAPPAQTARELWALVLDVVCAPLALRVRAAELLGACADAAGDARVAAAAAHEPHKLRAVVSSTCQALEELRASDAAQAALLFAWLGFLERVLRASAAAACARALRGSMYAGMLAKLLRLLTSCSTHVFAAATVCLALLHRREREGGSRALLDALREPKDGREQVGGALLHVINSCGCPCPPARREQLWDALQLFADVLADEAAALVFLNDFKVLLDLVIRECTDLPPEDVTRLHYVALLERALDSPLYLQAQMYRKRELWKLLESLLDVGAEEDSVMPKEVVEKVKQILVKYIDLLD